MKGGIEGAPHMWHNFRRSVPLTEGVGNKVWQRSVPQEDLFENGDRPQNKLNW